MKKKRKFFTIIATLSIIVLLFVFFSMIAFYRTVQQSEYVFQEDLLKNLTIQNAALIDMRLDGYLDALFTLAEFLRDTTLNEDDISKKFSKILEHEEFVRIGVISTEGILWTTDKNNIDTVDISDRAYWQNLLNKKPIISEVRDSRITTERVFFVAVPILSESQKFLGAVHAAVNIEDFQNYTNARMPQTDYHNYLIDKKGEYIIRCQKHNKAWNYNSFFDLLNDISQGFDTTNLIQKLNTDKVFIEHLTLEGTEYISCFAPISINNWHTVITIPKDQIDQHIISLLGNNISTFIVQVLVSLSILCIAIIYYARKDAVQEKDREIQIREKLFSDIEGLIQADLIEDRIIYLSDSLRIENKNIKSYTEMMKFYVNEQISADYHANLLNACSIDNLMDIYTSGINRISQEYLVKGPKESLLWNQCEIHIQEDAKSGHPWVYYIIKNIDEKKRQEQTLKHKAEIDGLTGLYNRSACTSTINNLFHQEKEDNTDCHAFIILDLDNFKTLNDTLLHKTGDKALQEVAKILQGTFSKEDLICRLGGDEFVVFIKKTDEQQIKNILDELIGKLTLTYEKNNKAVKISASAGVALAPKHGTNFSKLYQSADQALYKAKRNGKSMYCFYDEK